MRFAHVATIYLLALTSANAETATTLSAVESEHPHWFTEPEPYRPCPALLSFLVNVMPVSAYRNTLTAKL
jgi:hypothetical protein